MKMLDVRGLQKTYASSAERLTVLRRIDLAIDAGVTVVIGGESGSGKSTLLNLIGGLDTPSGGSIVVHGRELAGFTDDELARYRNRFVGYVFQFHYLLKDFTALENVLMPAYIAGEAKRHAVQRASQLLREVGLWERKGHYPFELSGGERQRVAVARSLMNDPALILADEPTGSLDEDNSAVVADKLFELVERYGKSMILVTHDQTLQERGQHRFLLRHGELVPA